MLYARQMIEMNMNSEEKYIKERIGQRNPFQVPEGYFDNLCSEVMAKLPEAPVEHQKPALLYRMRPYLYAAACLLTAVFTITVFFGDADDDVAQQEMTAQGLMNDTYLDDAVDYAMVDNYDIYACLTNE
jgi:hypothetical protein